MEIGKYNIRAFDAGGFKLDGGAMFGIIPKPLWEKTNPADTSNRVQLSTRVLYVTYENRKVLIDTGMGIKWDEKSRNIYGLDHLSSPLSEKLRTFHVEPDDITDVILTHLHFDHAGGAVVMENDKLIPAFKNARYYVQKENFDWAMNPSDRDSGSYIKSNYVPLVENGILTFTNPGDLFDDGFQFMNIYGHTFAQQLVKFSDSNKTLVYCGDLVPFSSHFHLPYIMGYDLQPLVTLKEKKELLSKAADNEWILVFEHDPFIAGATVLRTEKGFAIKEKYEII